MDEKPVFNLKRAALFAAVFVIGIGIGSQMPAFSDAYSGNPEGIASEEIDFGSVVKALELLDENFVPATTTDPLSTDEKVWGMIKGLAEAYGDEYTVFLPPVETEIFESDAEGNFEGVGIEIAIRDGILTVVSPIKGTPGYRAGVESGDKIVKIDGEDTQDITVLAAVKKIRGPRGSTVTLSLVRDGGAPFDVAIVRDTIDLPTIETNLRSDGVFVIELYSFNAAIPQRFREAVAEFADSGSDKLIIDLRGNPGGYLEVAVDLASWFLPVGKPIVITDYGEKQSEDVVRSRGYDVFTDRLKLAILIDGGSASASEILAGALRAHGEATIIGTKSFGKGSVQQTFPITDQTILKVTIARWLTPDRISISHEGITPDIVVEVTEEDREAGNDPQLERAAEFLKTGK
jgi:carboxyl-terminal processing protease